MLRLLTAGLALGLGLGSGAVNAQNEPEKFNQPRTQGEIMKERADACRDLKGDALRECLANYVGPKRDAETQSADGEPSSGGAATGSPHPPQPAPEGGDLAPTHAPEPSAPK